MGDRFKPCSVAGCDRNAHRDEEGKKGFCSAHYQRAKRHGDPSIVKKTPSPALDWIEAHKDYTGGDCLRWPFAIGKDGYGRAHRRGTSRLTTASNLMCEAAHGQKPSPRHECAHSCGRGDEACVNQNHLRWATPEENQRERVVHGTSNRGERQWRSKLSRVDVRAIRALAECMPQSKIAARFQIDQGHISAIVARKKWAWLD